jgi:hypothetical protein
VQPRRGALANGGASSRGIAEGGCDVFPQQIIQSGMAEAWRKAPVSLEICGTFLSWRDKQGYGEKQVRYIFDHAQEPPSSGSA